MFERRKWTASEIKALRLKFGLTQKEMSQVVGTGGRYQTISEWELDMYTPNNAYSTLLVQIEKSLNDLHKAANGDEKKFRDALHRKYGVERKK